MEEEEVKRFKSKPSNILVMVHELFGNCIKGYGSEYYSALIERMSMRVEFPLYLIKIQKATK